MSSQNMRVATWVPPITVPVIGQMIGVRQVSPVLDSEFTTPAFPEAPLDGQRYGRMNAGWSLIPPVPFASDAPSNANTYGRLGGAWAPITKSTVGLTSADNTSDANKPISIATQNALNLKVDEAPNDGVQYARQSKAWSAVVNPVFLTVDDNQPAVYKIGDRWIRPETGQEAVRVPTIDGVGAWVAPAGAADETLTPFLLNDGTVAQPGLAWASEPGLGWYRPSAGRIAVASNGLRISDIDSSTAAVTGMGLYPRAAGNANFTLANVPHGTTNFNALSLGIGGTGASIAVTKGGTATDIPLALTAPAGVYASNNFFALNSTGGVMGFTWDGGNGNYLNMLNTGTTWRWLCDRTNGALVWQRAGQPSTQFASNGDFFGGRDVWCGGDSTMGLVISNPASRYLQFAIDGWRLQFVTANGNLQYVNFNNLTLAQIDASGSIWAKGDVTASNAIYSMAGFIQMRSDSAPKLSFCNAAGTQNAEIQGIGTGGTIRVNSNGHLVDFQSDGNFVIQAGGIATKPGGGPFAVLSDERVKEEVGPYERGLADVLAYRPIVYRYINDESGKEFVGRVAQEVQVVDASMVFTATVEGEDLEHIDLNADTYKLFNAVRELHERVSALEAA